MLYQPTKNQLQAQLLMQIVYMPMISLKIGRYSLRKIIEQHLLVSQLSPEEKNHIKNGIKALVDLGIFGQDGNDICITNISEALIESFDNLFRGTVEEVTQSLKESPKFSKILASIEEDARLMPYKKDAYIANDKNISKEALQTKPLTSTNKFFIAIMFVFMLLGVLKLFGF